MKSLCDVETGEKVRVVRVDIKGPSGRRYREMGILEGEILKVIRVAPLGDPIDIEVKGYNLSLRKDEAKDIIVEVVE